MEQSYRIRANVGADQVIRTTLQQDIDMLEILSLKIKQSDVYKLHTSNYGMIVGRVLANEAVGIFNAKVSVFVELDDIDKRNSEITQFYPFETVYSQDENGVRYNLLKDSSNDECYQEVGTFPNKRLVLDNDTMIEIFDKYWKYTTVTNQSGDYMIPCVLVGNQQIHVDIDLSDIGVLSQKPRDFMYKGYNITQFDNVNQFKDSTNLDNLSQIISQNTSVYVYPFWGSEDVGEVAITRCDIQVAYKFEPTCVFFGSIVSDNFSNNIGHKCNPSKFVGFNRNLVAGEGVIEMIRKTPDGLVEDFQIQGNRLIDGNGVWCYQIPMNLDYVMTDEFGNIVPADGNKGIATRTSVRFRISMQETNSEGISRHRARYLVPNVHQLVDTFGTSTSQPMIADPSKYDQCYEFGSATPDEFFRDLYWNKVYTVKNYIPRIQRNGQKNTQKYSAIRTVNDNGNLNPFPFNHGRFRLVFGYRVLCVLMSIVFKIMAVINTFLSSIVCLKFLGIRPFKFLCSLIKCIAVRGGLTEDEDSNIEYFPGCKRGCSCMMKCEQKGCQQESSYQKLMDTVQQNLSQEYDVINLDFYNDWVNGTLYMPLWFWKKTKKRKFLFGLFSVKAKNAYCSCDTNYPKLRVTENCSIPWANTETGGADSDETNTDMHHVFPSNAPRTIYGIVKEVENKDGLKLYYYAPGVPNVGNYKTITEKTSYVRLYSTDIVLLGSLNECDLDNLPRPFINLPSTTSNIPYIRTLTESASTDDDDESTLEGTIEEGGVVQVTGMDWESGGGSTHPKFGRGLLMDMTCVKIRTRPKSCINLSRMSELGVGLDITVDNEIPEGGTLKYNNTQIADGMITRYEIVDHETRAMFASLNHNGLMEKVRNKNTGYDTYKLEYTYLNDFDGRMKDASAYTSMMEFKTYDIADQSYVNFRLGKVLRKDDNGEYKRTTSHFYDGEEFPLFNNSFFFYFGLNEGNTAIDKFNNLFYASCYKNQKYPFSLTYTTMPAKWCKKGTDGLTTDYGTMDITFKGIKVPYSYTLYNNFGEEIISESNVYTTDLKFGYESDGHTYVKDANGNLKKYGLFTPFGEPSSAITSGTYVENGVYVIEVKDANGSSLKQSLTLHQMGISVTTESINLGDKFYSSVEEDGSIKPISTANDFCGENIDLYGEIIVKQIDIDGKHYGVETISATTTPNQYELKLTNKDDNTDTEEVILTLSLVDGGSGEDCMCPEVSGEPKSHTYVLEDGQLTFHVWQPQTYKIHVVQKCNEGVNDNEMTTNVVIANGEPFNAYLNDMPVKFMLNSNFYTPNNTATTLSATSIKGWMNLHNPSNYSWPVVSYRNANTWGDFTDVEVETSGATSALTLTSKLNILEYQINSMFNLCRSAYVVGGSDNTMTISSTGGKGPILYRGNYPLYSDIPDDSSIESTYDGWLFDSDGTVTCNPKFPNIVGENYTLYYGETDYYIPLIRWNHEVFEELKNTRAFLNPIYQDSGKTGNYFAVFTNNGGIKKTVTNTSSTCGRDPNAAYQASPSNAQPNYSICPGFSDENFYGSTYLRGFFTDKRFDYDMIIWAPTYYEITQQTSTSNDNDWKLGRISGVTYNGVEMAYDGEYNIIGKDLEYEVSGGTLIDEFDSKDYQLSHKTKNDKRRQYSSTLKMDNQTIDLREMYQNRGDITYPMRRELNIPIIGDGVKIQPSQKMKFTNVACSYDIEVASESTEGGVVFTGVIEPGEETTFTVDCRSQISVVSSGLSTMAQADKADLYYASNGGVQHVDFKFKIGQDKYNKTHNITTFLPFFWRAPDGEGVEYLFNLIKKIKKVEKFEDLMKQLVENTYKHGSGYKNAHGTKDIWKQAEYDGSLRPMTDDIRCDTLNTDYARYLWYSGDGDRVHHWFEDDDRDKIVYDDDSRVRNIIYSIDRPTQALAIVLLRQYLNAEDDNLSKNIMLLNTSTIFDFTKNISVTYGADNNWMYTSTDLSGETDDDVVTEVSGGGVRVSKDDEGNITGVTGGGVSSDEEKVGVTTSSVTSYENSIQIKVSTNDPGWNNGGGENGMEALLVVNKQYHLATSIISDGGETSAISNSSFSTIFQFDWSSANFKDMLGPEKPDKAENGNAECLMFVKLNDNKQKMVAKLKFNIGWRWSGSSYSLTSLTLNNSK